MDNPDNQNQKDRRQFVRVEKHFIISCVEKNGASTKHDVTQLKNISIGGMCFVTAHHYPSKTHLSIELRTPFLSDIVHLEGVVLESREKIPGMLFETRLIFDKLDAQTQSVLNRIVETFLKTKEGGEKTHE